MRKELVPDEHEASGTPSISVVRRHHDPLGEQIARGDLERQRAARWAARR
jgi:hypothetical protein